MCAQCVNKIMTFKIALTIYSKQYKKEASSCSRTNYVMDI